MEHVPDRQQATDQRAQVPAWVLDLLLGVAVSLVIALVISADQGGSQDPDAVAYLFALAFGALMLMRRHFPVAVLVMTMLLLFVYYALGYPAIGLAVPVSAALYSAAELGRLPAAVLVSSLLIVVSTYVRLRDGQPVAYLLGYELISTATLMAAAIALGDSTRARRALRAEQEQSARLIEQEHAYRAEQRVQAERVRMARDLHDVIGHSISIISLHADVAREAIGHDEDEARRALAHIRAASSDTMRELRATVKLLRRSAGDAPDRSTTSLANLSTLVERTVASGVQVEVNLAPNLVDERQALPASVDTAAYRIIQESLTNVIRHAGATRASVDIWIEAQVLRVRITDNGITENGTAFVPADSMGSGIAGMTERVRLLGGTLTAHAQPEGGFAVNATIPLVPPAVEPLQAKTSEREKIS